MRFFVDYGCLWSHEHFKINIIIVGEALFSNLILVLTQYEEQVLA